jgi:hypothetical protein
MSPSSCPQPDLAEFRQIAGRDARDLIGTSDDAIDYVQERIRSGGWSLALGTKVVGKIHEIVEEAESIQVIAATASKAGIDGHVTRIKQIWTDVVQLSFGMLRGDQRGKSEERRKELSRDFRQRLNPSSPLSRALYDSSLHPACL